MIFNDIYRGKKVLVTGHAGFKGSWLCFWLKKLGAEVIGYGHAPHTELSHHYLLGNPPMDSEYSRLDLLNKHHLNSIMGLNPDLVIHLAAKAIVARTFRNPQETFENNVMGAVNILEACRQAPSVKGVVMITTDKVYEDKNWRWGYRENDTLGGEDPYSSSKVCIEQVIRCYRKSFGMTIITARAGNVIGGGDWSEKRLIPDIVRAAARGEKSLIHTPYATRPWQHVLEPLYGYLLLGQRILETNPASNLAYNFGPEGEMTVLEVLDAAQEAWPSIKWEIDDIPTHPGMVYLLKLDSTKSKKDLGWEPVFTMKQAVQKTIWWYRGFYETGKIRTGEDLAFYEHTLRRRADHAV